MKLLKINNLVWVPFQDFQPKTMSEDVTCQWSQAEAMCYYHWEQMNCQQHVQAVVGDGAWLQTPYFWQRSKSNQHTCVTTPPCSATFMALTLLSLQILPLSPALHSPVPLFTSPEHPHPSPHLHPIPSLFHQCVYKVSLRTKFSQTISGVCFVHVIPGKMSTITLGMNLTNCSSLRLVGNFSLLNIKVIVEKV